MDAKSIGNDVNERNRLKFMALVDAFDLQLVDVAKVIGLSRPLLSRAIHGHGGITHEAVYARLEKHLPAIVACRGRAFFEVEAVGVGVVNNLGHSSSSLPTV